MNTYIIRMFEAFRVIHLSKAACLAQLLFKWLTLDTTKHAYKSRPMFNKHGLQMCSNNHRCRYY